MLLTDPKLLTAYGSTKRLWQGIPGIEVTPGGRRFVVFYSGGSRECIGNYVVLLCAEAGGTFGECAVVAPEDGHRYVFAKSSEECVLGILKMIDHWDTYFPAPEEPEKPQGPLSKMLHTVAAVFFHP